MSCLHSFTPSSGGFRNRWWRQSPSRTRQQRHAESSGSRHGEKRAGNSQRTDASDSTAAAQEQEPETKGSRLKEIIKKLSEMGPPGVAAYGVLNSMYYTGVVAFIFLLQKNGSDIGLKLGAKKLGEAFLSAWALSQLTKVPRALGAIALAPVTNTFMTWLIEHTWIENRRQGLIAITLACLVVVSTVMGCLLLTVI